MVEITVAYYLGIDGGGSKTACAIGDDHVILASSTAGPSNITRIGEDRARESIHQAIKSACGTAKLRPKEIKRTCIGAAGAAREEVAAALHKFCAELVGGEVQVVGDMAIAMEAAFGEEPGVIVIAGTGSIAYGRSIHGTTARAGGWGFAIGDEGSAHWIGREAFTALLRAADERASYRSVIQNVEISDVASAALLRELKAIWNVESLEQLARVANSNPNFSLLFPAVATAADKSDNLARELLEKAAAELARLADVVIQRLFSPERSTTIEVAMVGGVFRHAETVRRRFGDQVRATHPETSINPEIVEPVYGALQMARRCKP